MIIGANHHLTHTVIHIVFNRKAFIWGIIIDQMIKKRCWFFSCFICIFFSPSFQFPMMTPRPPPWKPLGKKFNFWHLYFHFYKHGLQIFVFNTPLPLELQLERDRRVHTQIGALFLSLFFLLAVFTERRRANPFIGWYRVWFGSWLGGHWCLVTMKICSLDTEVTATAPHQVAICDLCVLHHCKNQADQTLNSQCSLTSRQCPFSGTRRASRFSFIFQPHHTGVFPLFSQNCQVKTILAPLYVSGDSINLALAYLICWHRRHIVAAFTVNTEVKRERELSGWYSGEESGLMYMD